MGKGTRRRAKKKVSAAKRIKPCDFYSKDHAAWLKRQEEPRVASNKGFRPKKLAPGEERVPWRLKFMMECQELMSLSKSERKQKLLEKYNRKSPYLEKLEKREQERLAELEKRHQIELDDGEQQLTKKEQLFKGIHEEKLKALHSVVDADGRDRGTANDTALVDAMSKKQKGKLRLREREKRLKEKKLAKKLKAQERIHKSTDFVKFGDVAQAPPTLPTIVFNFYFIFLKIHSFYSSSFHFHSHFHLFSFLLFIFITSSSFSLLFCTLKIMTVKFVSPSFHL